MFSEISSFCKKQTMTWIKSMIAATVLELSLLQGLLTVRKIIAPTIALRSAAVGAQWNYYGVYGLRSANLHRVVSNLI